MGSAIEQLCQARLGTMLRGKWKLDRVLGIGGMAAVYAGEHKIGRRDAIKILHPEIARQPELRKRFEIEASATNRFHHAGAVEIRDVDVTEDGCPFLVMEMLDGESLGQRARRLGEIEESDLLRYVDELLDVLAAAHKEGIVHRDIKLDNVFITEEGRVKVLDFGIARMRSAVPLTMAGTRLGTTAYMPPEQLRGLEIDGRADLFAVGATMFRLIAKRRVHEAPSDGLLVVKMSTEPAPRLRAVAPNVSPNVALVVDRALEFEANDRYPNALTMQADVRAVREGRAPDFALARSSGAPPLRGSAYEPTGAMGSSATRAAALGAPAGAAPLEPTNAAAPAPIAARASASAALTPAAPREPTAATVVPPKGPGGTLVTEPTSAGATAATFAAPTGPHAWAPGAVSATIPEAPGALGPTGPAHAPSFPNAYAPAGPSAYAASASMAGATSVSGPPSIANGHGPPSGPMAGGYAVPGVTASSGPARSWPAAGAMSAPPVGASGAPSAMAFASSAPGVAPAGLAAAPAREERRNGAVIGFVLIGLVGLVTLGGAITYFVTRPGSSADKSADVGDTARTDDAKDDDPRTASSAAPETNGASSLGTIDIPPPDRTNDSPSPGGDPTNPAGPATNGTPAAPAPTTPTHPETPTPPIPIPIATAPRPPPTAPPPPPPPHPPPGKDKHKPHPGKGH